jgi:hypothetical protein
MVQVSFDTNVDTLEELEHALHLLQKAIERRNPEASQKGAAKFDIPRVDAPTEVETALETPFLKITLEKHEQRAKAEPKMPTLNQLINDESLSEDDLGKLFKAQMDQEEEEKKAHPEKHVEKHKEETQDSYIEIVEYEEKD